MVSDKVTAKALGIIMRGNDLLVYQGFDASRHLTFYRLLGGTIEFGETSEVALHREFMEEMNATLLDVQLMGVLENIFEYDRKPGHEICFIYTAKLANESLYAQEEFFLQEADGSDFRALWLPLDVIPAGQALFPAGILELINTSLGI